MIVATNADLRPLFGGLLDGSGPGGSDDLVGDGSGTWIVEPFTRIRPQGRSACGEPSGEGRAWSPAAVGRPATPAGARRPAGRLPPAGAARPRRPGGRLEGPAPRAVRRPRGAEDPQAVDGRTTRHGMAQFRREAERGGRLAGPSLLPVYELGDVRRIPLHGHAVRRGHHAPRGHPGPRRPPRRQADRGDPSPGHPRRAGVPAGHDPGPHRRHRGPGPGPRPAGRASRRQAGEHPAGQPPARGRLPLRLRPGPRPGDRHPPADARWRRHPDVHGPRAPAPRRRRRDQVRHLLHGRDDLRGDDAGPPVPGPRARDVLGAAGVPGRLDAATAGRGPARVPRGPRGGHPQGDGAQPRGPL